MLLYLVFSLPPPSCRHRLSNRIFFPPAGGANSFFCFFFFSCVDQAADRPTGTFLAQDETLKTHCKSLKMPQKRKNHGDTKKVSFSWFEKEGFLSFFNSLNCKSRNVFGAYFSSSVPANHHLPCFKGPPCVRVCVRTLPFALDLDNCAALNWMRKRVGLGKALETVCCDHLV